MPRSVPALPVLALLSLAAAVPAAAQTGPAGKPWAKLCPADAAAWTGCTVKGTQRMVAVCIPKGAQLQPTGEDDGGKVKMATPKLAFIRYRVGTPTATRMVLPPKREGSAATFRYGLVTYAAGWASTFIFTHQGDEFRLVERNIAGERDASGRRARDITHYFEVAGKKGRPHRYPCDDDNQK